MAAIESLMREKSVKYKPQIDVKILEPDFISFISHYAFKWRELIVSNIFQSLLTLEIPC